MFLLELVRQCEVMVRLICHASKLKVGKNGLRGLPIGACMCINCDLGAVKDCSNLFMQCPYHEKIIYMYVYECM